MFIQPTNTSRSSPATLHVAPLVIALLMTVGTWFLQLSVLDAFAGTSSPSALHCRDGAISYVHSTGAACQTHGGVSATR